MKHFPEIFGAVVALVVCTFMVRYLASGADDWGLGLLVAVCAAIVAVCLLIGLWWDRRQASEHDQDRVLSCSQPWRFPSLSE